MWWGRWGWSGGGTCKGGGGGGGGTCKGGGGGGGGKGGGGEVRVKAIDNRVLWGAKKFGDLFKKIPVFLY